MALAEPVLSQDMSRELSMCLTREASVAMERSISRRLSVKLQPYSRSLATAAATPAPPRVPTIDQVVGDTPLVALQRIHLGVNPGAGNRVFVKLEGSNPGGSAKDRPALAMLEAAEASGALKPGGHVIECTTGNTGIALAMMCAARGYKLTIVMPGSMTEERKAAIAAYGAELVLTPTLEEGRTLARRWADEGRGVLLDQNNNPANPAAHYKGTGQEIWRQTGGTVTHFLAGMGTTGTLVGTATALKDHNPAVVAIGLEPPASAATSVPGIRRWPEEFRPRVRDDSVIDDTMEVTQQEAEETARALARTEGLLLGISAAGAVSAALRLCARVRGATIVVLACDRADRYLSTGVFSAAAGAADPRPCSVAEMGSAIARFAAYPAPHFVLFTAAAEQAAGAAAAAQLEEQAVEQVAGLGGTLLTVTGLPDWSEAHMQSVQVAGKPPAGAEQHNGTDSEPYDAPVLVRWHGAEAVGSAAASAGAAAPATATPAAVTVLLRQREFVSVCREGLQLTMQ